MSLLNTKVLPFKTEAFVNGRFVTVTEESLKGHWSVIFFLSGRLYFCVSYGVRRFSRTL